MKQGMFTGKVILITLPACDSFGTGTGTGGRRLPAAAGA